MCTRLVQPANNRCNTQADLNHRARTAKVLAAALHLGNVDFEPTFGGHSSRVVKVRQTHVHRHFSAYMCKSIELCAHGFAA